MLVCVVPACVNRGEGMEGGEACVCARARACVCVRVCVCVLFALVLVGQHHHTLPQLFPNWTAG